jgi:hypothetical protein
MSKNVIYKSFFYSVWVLCWTGLFCTINLCLETVDKVQFEFSACFIKHKLWSINIEYIKTQRFSKSSLIETLLQNSDENSTWSIWADTVIDRAQCKTAFNELTYNSYNITNKSANVKITFPHTIFHNSACFNLSLSCPGSYLIWTRHI